jgi:hypothetical protein
MPQVEQYLPSKYEILRSNPSTTKKDTKQTISLKIITPHNLKKNHYYQEQANLLIKVSFHYGLHCLKKLHCSKKKIWAFTLVLSKSIYKTPEFTSTSWLSAENNLALLG